MRIFLREVVGDLQTGSNQGDLGITERSGKASGIRQKNLDYDFCRNDFREI
jgi:hypothetical protein